MQKDNFCCMNMPAGQPSSGDGMGQTKLFVGGLPSEYTAPELQIVFERYGALIYMLIQVMVEITPILVVLVIVVLGFSSGFLLVTQAEALQASLVETAGCGWRRSALVIGHKVKERVAVC